MRTLKKEAAFFAGRTFKHSQLRAYDGTAANQQRQDNWQPYTITVAELKPVPVLPKRLHTAFCWGGASEFVDNPARNLSSIGMYLLRRIFA
jgi:hypothetical protein